MKIQNMFLNLLLVSMLVSACSSAEPSVPLTTQATNTEVIATGQPEEPAPAEVVSSSGLEPAAIANDEGGPAVITGEWSYSGATVLAHFQEPVPMLINFSRRIQGNYSEFVPRIEQFLGTLTSSSESSPVGYQVIVPALPEGASVDLDNDGEQDAGVQVYSVQIISNLLGDSFADQYDQIVAYRSFLADPQTGSVREGSFLVYAPDSNQGFPGSAGEDGLFFTADDPAVSLPAGFTLVSLSKDGLVSFDRSRNVKIDTLEEAAAASPDFSAQGILESFNSLIDLLMVRYSYTELRQLDWEQIRENYLPQVQAADAADDMQAYYIALHDLAVSIRDAHVYTNTKDNQLRNAITLQNEEAFGGSLGAQVVLLSDGRYVITFLDAEGPGAKAGWQFGTEIVSVDGVPVGEYVDGLPVTDSLSTPESIRLNQMEKALHFPVGTETTVLYQQPGESEQRSATLIAGEGFISEAEINLFPNRQEISYQYFDDGVGYIQWSAFDNPLYKMAVFENFIKGAVFRGSPAIIIDLRGNGGGNAELLYSMASYLFSTENPAPLHWIDQYSYDEKVNDLVKTFDTEYKQSAWKPDLAYTGNVAVLVDNKSASASEFLSQYLQKLGRAIVVGEYGTEGAGGNVELAKMPGEIFFLFTKGRFYYAGTDELNLEGKGVTLDVRVPITEENEKAKQEGRDVVLEAALAALAEKQTEQLSASVVGKSWKWSMLSDVAGKTIPVENSEEYTINFGENGEMTIQADCNQAAASYAFGAGGTLTIEVGPTTLAVCPGDSKSEDFLRWLGVATSFQTDGSQLAIFLDPASGALMLIFEVGE